MNLFKSHVVSLTEQKGKKTKLTLFTPDHYAVRGTFKIEEVEHFPIGPNDPVRLAKELLESEVSK